jgi:phosphoglycerate kinase
VASFVDQAVMGRLMEKEIEALTRVRDDPEHPMVAILGGSKVSDKLGTIRALSKTADHVLIGGAMSYTFLQVLGHEVGESRIEADRLETAETLYKEAEGTLQLPTDHVVADELDAEADASVVEGDIPADKIGLDIGPATIEAYRQVILDAATVVWNGPMGVFEIEKFAKGTMAVANAVADATDAGAFSVVGGGDSVSALTKSGCTDRVSHVSTGGGALLAFLEGDTLPGIAALTDA